MNLNKFFKSLEYKNEIRNLLNDNRLNNDNLLFKSDTIKIDEIKKKYGYLNYTNSRKTFDIINKIKQKYINNNNYVIDNSNKNFEILKNSYNNNNNKMFNTLQYDKQNNFNFNNNNLSKTNKLKISLDKLNFNNDNNNKFIFNEEDNNINSDERELLNTENISNNKMKKFNNIFPISKRICLLCSLKQNIDKITKDDSRIINKNIKRNNKNKYYNNKYNKYFIDISSQNSSSSRINLGFNKINPNVSKSSIFDQVFTSRNKSNNENEISPIQSPILLNKHVKPKINVPNYNNFMYI